MSRITALAIAAAASFMAISPAQAEEEAAPELPAAGIVPLPIAFDATGLSGEGADALRDAMPDAQFVMIGEAHGHAGAPQLLGALAAEGKEHGFDNYAIEVGPYSTRWMRDVLADGGSDALGTALQGRPLALPFFSAREEADAALPFLDDDRLWGVDQEFIGSPLIHLDLLRALKNGDPDWINALATTERESFAAGNQGAVLMVKATPQDWARLRAAFAADAEALALIGEVERSAAIYRSIFAGRGLDNNLDRVAMMREYFLDRYHAAEAREGKPPRVLMKFGAVHGGRATSAMSTFDLGSLVEGMAAANRMEALHIAYLPVGGEQLAVFPSPEGAFQVKPVDGAKLREVLVKGGVDVAAIEASQGHFLIPLEDVKRNLRNKGLAELDWMGRFMVLGFDYLVTTNAAAAAQPLAQ